MITVNVQILIRLDPPSAYDFGKRVMQREIKEGSNVGDLLGVLADEHGPSFTKNVYNTEKRALYDVVMVTLNGRLLSTLNGVDTVLQQGDLIVLLPLMMGG